MTAWDAMPFGTRPGDFQATCRATVTASGTTARCTHRGTHTTHTAVIRVTWTDQGRTGSVRIPITWTTPTHTIPGPVGPGAPDGLHHLPHLAAA